jgi:hypothetical protein
MTKLLMLVIIFGIVMLVFGQRLSHREPESFKPPEGGAGEDKPEG